MAIAGVGQIGSDPICPVSTEDWLATRVEDIPKVKSMIVAPTFDDDEDRNPRH